MTAQANERGDRLSVRSRWLEFGKVERMLVHHALRMFLTHPGTHGVERDLDTRLADEIWDEHAAEVSARLSSALPSASPEREVDSELRSPQEGVS